MFGMQGDAIGTIIWFLLFFVFVFIYPRMMLSQMIMKLEQSAQRMEQLSVKAKNMIVKKVGKKSKIIDAKVRNFQDFIAIEPTSLDPYGIVRKIDHITRGVETRFQQFVDEIAGEKNKREKQEINFGLRAAIGVHTIAKIVRHYVEIVKKFKNLQLAIILQMQLPEIERIAKSELKGTEAFVGGYPIGDSIGPMVAASLIDKSREITDDVVCGETKILGRKAFVLKAKGPGPHLGRIDEALEKILKKNRIARVITVDAAGKLEGEKTGSVAEGVGFAMAYTAERQLIEDILIPRKIPIDAIAVKVGLEEAITPMKMEIKNSIPEVIDAIKTSTKRTKKHDKIIVIGVGNSCGIGDDKKSLEQAEKIISRLDKKLKKEKEKKRRWF